jgi:hypothetical protein
MSWRISAAFAVSVSGLALTSLGAPARADEAYLCGPDRVVYVAVEDLEAKKHSDPCIAGYYGIKIEADAAPLAKPEKQAAKPVEKITSASVTAALKPMSEPETPSRTSPALQRQASLEPPRAMPGTDFRNVKVLNAESPEAAWFRHTK